MPKHSPAGAGVDHASPWGTYPSKGWRGASLGLAHAVPAQWALARRLVKVLRRPIKYGTQPCYDVTIWDWKLRLTPYGNNSESKLLYGPQLFDRREREFLATKLTPGATFVDIGANVGTYTYWACRCLAGQGRVVAFEPDDEMRARLEFNLRTNGIRQVEVVAHALSDHAGTAVLHINRLQRGENTLEVAQAEVVGGDRVTQSVRVDTLYASLQALGVERVDALKIDIEGHEMPVLRHFFAHAPQTLWPHALLAEHKHDREDAVGQLLETMGYRCVVETALNRCYER
jgi:FkbM family methyltransferase